MKKILLALFGNLNISIHAVLWTENGKPYAKLYPSWGAAADGHDARKLDPDAEAVAFTTFTFKAAQFL